MDLRPFDVTAEKAIPAREAIKLIPSGRGGGAHISLQTLIKWMRDGVEVHGASRVYLDGCKLGRTVFTSREAIQRFAQACSTPDGQPERRPATVRTAACEAASSELEHAGY